MSAEQSRTDADGEYIPADLKAEVVMLAKDYGQDFILVGLNKAGKQDFAIRSNLVEDEVLFNARIDVLINENKDAFKEDGKRWWCQACEEGNYFFCHYATKSVSSKQSCPEYDLNKTKSFDKDYVKKITEPDNKTQTKFYSGTGWTNREWATKDEKKAEEKPKTGFQMPTKSTSTLPYGLLYRCPKCWHWLESDQKLAAHAQWACPARDNNTPETQVFLIKCADGCCSGKLDDMLISKKPVDSPAENSTDDVEDTVPDTSGASPDKKEDANT